MRGDSFPGNGLFDSESLFNETVPESKRDLLRSWAVGVTRSLESAASAMKHWKLITFS